MKNEGAKQSGYAFLQWKIYVKVALIAFSALVTVFLIRELVSGGLGNFVVNVMRVVFGMSQGRALELYNLIIRRNQTYIMFAAVAVFFVILSRFLLVQFAKYFHEISDGLDVLVADKGGEIKLSSEMETMERKLKAIKNTLAEREQEARLAEQRKNDVVMYLAHDIKTPLTSVIGYLSLLDEAPDMPQEQKAKYVNITLEKANRLEKLVDAFFEITRYSLQAEALSKESIDLYYMLSQMTDEFYPLLAAKGTQARLHVPEDMVIYGDADKLARVFNNILKNAIAYSPGNSVIDISAAVSGGKPAGLGSAGFGSAGLDSAGLDSTAFGSVGLGSTEFDSASVVTSIMFTNVGSIPKDRLASIFDKFYRLDAARSTDTGGAGLGLAIAKEIVVSHGGRIYADSDGEKTTFTVELPGVV